MAYNTKKMLRDADNKLIPQFYDPVSDSYKPINDPTKVQLSGSNVKDVFTGSTNAKKNYSDKMDHFAIVNTGNSPLTFKINNLTIPVDVGESYAESFDEFTTVDIFATSSFKAQVKGKLGATVTPAPDTTAPTVTASPNGGTFTGTQSVTLTANESATIYYTTNGNTPTTASAVYGSPITISATTTLKYFAKDIAGNSSAVQTVTFTLQSGADTTAPVLTITPGGTFTNTQSVTMSINEAGTIYYTLDGSTPTASSSIYSTALTLTATTTLKAFSRDSSGNSSAVQTVTFTKEIGERTLIVSDTFNRADSTTSLGSADTGQLWEPMGGSTWGISGNLAHCTNPSGNGNLAVVDAGVANATVEYKVPANFGKIAVRVLDNAQFIGFQIGGTGYTAYKWNSGGLFTKIGDTTGVAHATGNIIKVVMDGDNFKFYVNDVLGIEFNNSGYNTSTKHGLHSSASSQRFDDFKIYG